MARPFTHREIFFLWTLIWLFRAMSFAVVPMGIYREGWRDGLIGAFIVALCLAGFEWAFIRHVRRATEAAPISCQPCQ